MRVLDWLKERTVRKQKLKAPDYCIWRAGGRLVELVGFSSHPNFGTGVSCAAVEEALEGRCAAFATTIRGQAEGVRWLKANGFEARVKFFNKNSRHRVTFWWKELPAPYAEMNTVYSVKSLVSECCGLQLDAEQIPPFRGMGLGLFSKKSRSKKLHYLGQVGEYHAYYQFNSPWRLR